VASAARAAVEMTLATLPVTRADRPMRDNLSIEGSVEALRYSNPVARRFVPEIFSLRT
jgi:hypothetical protein